MCLLMGSLLHFYDHPAAAGLVAKYTAALAPGSYVVLSTVAVQPDNPDVDQAVAVYSAGAHALYPHPAEEFAEYFGDLETVPPGVADGRTWRPGWEKVPGAEPRGVWMYAGMTRIPGH